MSQQEHRVYVTRHGETEWSLRGQHRGRTDSPLTENVRNRAKLLKPVLAGESFTLVRTSPMQRARETCRLAGLGDVAKVEPDLVEWSYGEYERITAEQFHAIAPSWQVFTDGRPGGEQPEQLGVWASRGCLITSLRKGAHHE